MNKMFLKYLLQNLIYGRITPDEYTEFKKEVKSADDETVDSALLALWEEEADFSPMDAGIKELVRYNLVRKALPVTTRKSSGWWKIAAAIAIPVLLCLSTYLYFSSGYNGDTETFVVFTEKGQRTQQLLPDGSKVY